MNLTIGAVGEINWGRIIISGVSVRVEDTEGSSGNLEYLPSASHHDGMQASAPQSYRRYPLTRALATAGQVRVLRALSLLSWR